ncbi:MAG: hypothetical protein A2X86_15555 [Bdellovibrionales bacterium GWA2_49_15]|nr:MAG: hypothetical protein A2X86_15555 [Bdellovibrionales bacterium GWA2_49_15]HAZ14546.1 hypothetical protein [Bdellovibrionales bacterium]
MRRFFLLMFLLSVLNFEVQAAPVISVQFKSFFRHHEVNFTTHRLIVLKIKISGVTPKKKKLLELKYAFANQPGEIKTLTKRANSRGEIELTKLLSLFKFYKRNLGKNESAKLFTAYVFLKDPSQDRHVTVAKRWSDLLVMPKGQDKIYRLNSEVLCQWQGDTRIDSEYFINDERVVKNITRIASINVRKGIRMDLGAETAGLLNLNIPIFKPVSPAPAGTLNPTPGSISPLGTSIYIGADFSKISSTRETFDLEQSWGLVPGQGGFIIRRASYSRYKAIMYEKEDGEYVAREEGILDVGQDGLSFAVVPRSFADNPEESLQFIDKMIEKVDSCRSVLAQNISSYVIENNNSQVLYIPLGEFR